MCVYLILDFSTFIYVLVFFTHLKTCFYFSISSRIFSHINIRCNLYCWILNRVLLSCTLLKTQKK
uniref:Uncharacterized protein n=1 Tax=Octopus bimaculoides TaxID=37653 RepID=A0A0L8GU02_OCTBM